MTSLSLSRSLFFDATNLNTNIKDSINNYAKVKEAVAVNNKGQIIKSLGTNKYKLIVLAGHGGIDELSIGCGMNPTNDKTKEITLKKFNESITFFEKCLNKNFDKENSKPILFLAGCNIYNSINPTDESLIKKISTVLQNVIVIAPGTLVKPHIKKNSPNLEIKLEVQPNKEADFDLSLSLGAYIDGEKIEEVEDLLDLTDCNEIEELEKALFNWQLKN